MKNLLTVSELFKTSWRDYRPRAGSFALFMLLQLAINLGLFFVLGIAFMILFFARARVIVEYFKAIFESQPAAFPLGTLLVFVTFFVIALIILVIFYNWLSLATWKFVLAKNHLDYGAALNTGWKNLFVFLWSNILRGLILIVSFLLFIIPGIIISVWYTFADILTARDNHAWPALKASRAMVRGRWWAVFGRVLLVFLMIFLPTEIISLLYGWSRGDIGTPISLLSAVLLFIYIVFMLLLTFFVSPWYFVFKKTLMENCEETQTAN